MTLTPLIHRDILHGHYTSLKTLSFVVTASDDRHALVCRIGMPGERIAILGRNGAGKSHTLQAMAGGTEMIQGDARR